MIWNQTKNHENRRNVGLNQGRRKSDVEIDVLAESRLSFLKTTLINLINTSKHSSMSVDRALTEFYKEVNKSIKRN